MNLDPRDEARIRGVFDRFDRMTPNEIRLTAVKYLAEHPADDDEPVNREWLLEHWIPHAYREGLFYVQVWHTDGCGREVLFPVDTRGDVRLLCRALRIEVAEELGGQSP